MGLLIFIGIMWLIIDIIKEARVMRDVDRMIERNAEEFKKRNGINK